MAGETIVVADDEPVRLKLTQAFLANQGYKVIAAPNAAEAGLLLGAVVPHLLYANLGAAGSASLDLIRLLRGKGQSTKVLVAAQAGEERKALEAGCDGLVLCPVEMDVLGARIRDMFECRSAAAAASGPGGSHTVAARTEAAAELDLLRARFLAEGREKLRELLQRLEERFDLREASKAVHQWIGTGGLLGFAAISRLARDAEGILAEPPLDNAQLREILGQLSAAFSSPREARQEPTPPGIVEALAGKRVAAVEFTVQQQERLYAALQRVGAEAVFLSAAEAPDCQQALAADAILLHVNAAAAASRWLDPAEPFGGRHPVVLTGSRDELVALPQAAQALAREFLMDSWQPEEALVRLSLAVAHPPEGRLQTKATPGVRAQIVIADDDPAVLSLVRIALENFGMDCHSASNGAGAIEAIRTLRPHAAVLDVNMPGMDGYEVLSAVRQDELPVRVLLLTACQRESDIIRGFTLGADDYVVKPFSPMELVARLKRLLSR
jgi:DNA-binding response OmpR family regulator